MIASLAGRLAAKGDGWCLLEVGGVGYRLSMSTPSLTALPHEGDDVAVHTYLHVRPEEWQLFGFESLAEKDLFEKLITVQGVGPKVALATLSALQPDALVDAIAAEDAGLIATVPGIGKKTAQRIVIELRDKLGLPEGLAAGTAPAAAPDALVQAREALLSMGFSSAEVAGALKGYEGDGQAQDLLKHALRRLGGGV